VRYTQKQIDKFNRQKYIVELEKISKNLFRMFRDENVSAEDFVKKFGQLKSKFDEKEEVHLESEYHQQLKEYITRIYVRTCLVEEFTDKDFSDIREAEMSNLNRLQKLKNGTSYKKDKHKSKRQNEDWG
jgi:phosphate uptake regulator